MGQYSIPTTSTYSGRLFAYYFNAYVGSHELKICKAEVVWFLLLTIFFKSMNIYSKSVFPIMSKDTRQLMFHSILTIYDQYKL